MTCLRQITFFYFIFFCLNDLDKSVTATQANKVRRAIQKYTTKYDNFDVAGVLASSRLVKRYTDCLMERGPCPPEGRILKDIIPDAIRTQCSKCSEVQKKQAGLVLHHLLLNYRDIFIELCDKYDPDGKARKQYGIDIEEDEEDYQDLDQA